MQKVEKERQKMQEKEHQKELQENLQIMLRITKKENELWLGLDQPKV